jgi:hypothetical protein
VDTADGALPRVLFLLVMARFFMPEWSMENLIQDALFVVGVVVVVFGRTDYTD